MSEPSAKKGNGGKKRIVVIAAPVLLLVAGAGLWFGGIIPHGGGKNAGAAHVAAAEKPVLIDLPDIVSNLDTGNHRASFIKVHAKVEVSSAADAAALQAATPRILDIFQTYLRGMRPEELRGGEATYRLREALMNRVDVVMAPVRVTDLLFTELLVQ